MSTTIYDLKKDTNDLFLSALNSDDMNYVMRVAQILAGIPGWEEEASLLKKRANENSYVEVIPNVFQTKEDYEANMAFDEMRDNHILI